MKLLIDENMSSRRLFGQLLAVGHDVVMVGDIGLLSATDPRVLTWAIAQDRPILTRDYEDFTDLHDLVLGSGGHHPGLLVVRFDNDPRHNLTDRGILTALGNLESSGLSSVMRSTS